MFCSFMSCIFTSFNFTSCCLVRYFHMLYFQVNLKLMRCCEFFYSFSVVTAWGDDIINVVSQRLSDTLSCAVCLPFSVNGRQPPPTTQRLSPSLHSCSRLIPCSLSHSLLWHHRTGMHAQHMDFSRLRTAIISQRNVRLSVV